MARTECVRPAPSVFGDRSVGASEGVCDRIWADQRVALTSAGLGFLTTACSQSRLACLLYTRDKWCCCCCCCWHNRKLQWNRFDFQEPTAKGLSGQIPAAWSGMTNLELL
jgi:hypothetical protein